VRTFTCTSFEGFWPVGTAAVVVARNEEMAAKMLNEHLDNIGLEQSEPVKPSQMAAFHPDFPQVIVLNDGNY